MQQLSKTGSWREQAACKGAFGGPFYPPQSGESRAQKRLREEQAKRICKRCLVSEVCLDWALHNGEVTGIWGGTTEVERRVMTRLDLESF